MNQVLQKSFAQPVSSPESMYGRSNSQSMEYSTNRKVLLRSALAMAVIVTGAVVAKNIDHADAAEPNSIQACNTLVEANPVQKSFGPVNGVDIALDSIALNKQPCVGVSYTAEGRIRNIGTTASEGVVYTIEGDPSTAKSITEIREDGRVMPIVPSSYPSSPTYEEHCKKIAIRDIYSRDSFRYLCRSNAYRRLAPDESMSISIDLMPTSATINSTSYLRLDAKDSSLFVDANPNNNAYNRRPLLVNNSQGESEYGVPPKPVTTSCKDPHITPGIKKGLYRFKISTDGEKIIGTGNALSRVPSVVRKSARVRTYFRNLKLTRLGRGMKRTGKNTIISDLATIYRVRPQTLGMKFSRIRGKRGYIVSSLIVPKGRNAGCELDRSYKSGTTFFR